MADNKFEVKDFVKTMKANDFYYKYSDPKLISKLCEECPKYNKDFSCPPYDFDIEKSFLEYDYIEIRVNQITFSDELRKTPYTPEEIEDIFKDTFYPETDKVRNELFEKEKDYDKAISLIGPCKICCSNCREKFDKCRFPEKQRHAVESMNINVTMMLEDLFDIKLEFVDEKIPEYLDEDEELSSNKTYLTKTMNCVYGLLYSK